MNGVATAQQLIILLTYKVSNITEWRTDRTTGNTTGNNVIDRKWILLHWSHQTDRLT